MPAKLYINRPNKIPLGKWSVNTSGNPGPGQQIIQGNSKFSLYKGGSQIRSLYPFSVSGQP